MLGLTLSHFRITAKLGEGGMGEVWRAEDTRLGREVAIKVLPAALTADAERLARFEREARVLAALNHPSIAAIYEVGEATVPAGAGAGLAATSEPPAQARAMPPGAGEASAPPATVHFLAMELAEGEDLALRLSRGPLGLEAALPIALQVASALEAAHEKGIVHRDLKPANVIVGAEGAGGPVVKVLDFGLAKALAADGQSDAALSLSPTLTAQMTQAGVILGTASYMSPEQARGRAVDRRADIWAFGVLLLEMLTGKRTFAGETTTDVLAAVVRATPDLSAIAGSTPRRLIWLLERCLEKDPQRRLRDIGEARVVLGDLLHGAGDVEEAVASRAAADAGLVVPWLWAAGAALVVGTLAFLIGQRTSSPAIAGAGAGLDADLVVRKLTFHPGLQNEPAISPDGNYVAFTSNESGNLDIVVMPLAGGVQTPVVTHPGDDAQPAWSPDGKQLAFTSARDRSGRLSIMTGVGELSQFSYSVGGDVFLAPALGGPAVKLVDDAAHPAWSPDGTLIAFESERSGSWDIWSVSTRGGTPTRLTDDVERDFQPAYSPDGRWLVYGSLAGLSVIPAAGGEPTRLTDAPTVIAGPAWSPDGASITFALSRGGRLNLWRLPFDGRTGRAAGAMERVSLGEGSDIEPGYGPDRRTLAYATVHFAADVWELDPATGERRQVTHLSSHEDYPQLGPDGRTLVLESTRGGERAVWASDRSGESMRKISRDGISALQPRWSPDGQSVAYVESPSIGGGRAIVHRLGELAGRPFASDVPFLFPAFSPDGRRLALADRPLRDVWILDLESGDATRITDGAVESGFPTWSPDGEWLAFSRRGAAAREVWLMRPDGSAARRLSRNPELDLSHPQWSPAGPDRILVVADHENLGLVSVATGELTLLTDYDDSTLVVDYPSWSADGRLIHFSLAQRSGDVYLMAPAEDRAEP